MTFITVAKKMKDWVFSKWGYITIEHSIIHEYLRVKYKRKLNGLYNSHVGRCFIIGNGPSLTVADLDLLKNEVCFGANRIYYMFDKTDWRPTYYCSQDIDVIEDIAEEITNWRSCFSKVLLINDCAKYFSGEIINDPDVILFFARFVKYHTKRKFSDDISKYIDGGGTITYAAIQIAAYMGFKEIYLLGVDHSYTAQSFKNGQLSASDVKGSYFAGMPTNIKMTRPNTDNSTISFEEAKRYCDEHGIIIKNATRGGYLEVFERIDLKDALKL